MSIAIIRGPQSIPSDDAGREVTSVRAAANEGIIPRKVISQLVEYASKAGKTVALRNCHSEAELLGCLHGAGEARYEFVIFDPGICACNDDRLRTALSQMKVPYIEVHDDHCGALEPALAPECGPRLHLIQGYGAQSYTQALSLALEYLGCAECENDIHVGI